jgi:hypothetical protein
MCCCCLVLTMQQAAAAPRTPLLAPHLMTLMVSSMLQAMSV